MTITARVRQWIAETGEYKAGVLYKRGEYTIYRLVKRFLSRVEISDEHIEELRKLGEQGVVVYAIKHKSQLNCLILDDLAERNIFPAPSYCHGVNMTIWQPFPIAWKVFISSLFRRTFKKKPREAGRLGHLEGVIKDQRHVIIHLGSSEFFDNEFVDRTLTRLIKSQKDLDVSVFLVPVLITYGRRRLREEEGIISILFGQDEHTGPLRRVITFLRYASKASVIMAEPIKLSDYLEDNQALSTEALAGNLRGELIDRIDDEKASIVGPVLKSREEIINITLRDDLLREVIEELAVKEKKSYEALNRQARKNLQEIAADYNDALVELWARFLTWLWNNIYDGLVIDREGLAKIRSLSKKMPFVIIPCHRSHIDYLVLSYVFYMHKIQMPFIAAGENLSFWPIGYLFRKSGAFFLRRTFKGDVLYGEVFAKYLKILMQEGLPMEFFIEGGRSRTGKMVLPKYGILSMIIQAYQEKACNDLAMIPIYIGYDKVVEEKAYLNELAGAAKEREKTTDVIKSGKILGKRFGSVYVNVGEPVLLKSYLAEQEKSLTEMNTSERQSFYRKIGYEIVLAINEVSVVTPFSLVATGLLSHDRRGIAHEELMEVLDGFYEYLTHRKVRFSATFS
ncbi:MAG: 1-acyl-sn-glycerol-3-phosphate acyltransferase, partial [Smithellaceae bacterium]|nr:1-acyl-sn-glycerol-3-phosphate acyltransferase [Smithellaceae bacterium]